MKLKYIHRTGSKPFSQVAWEMEVRDGKPPAYEDLFAETHKRKGNNDNDPNVQSKLDEMREIRRNNPEIPDLSMIEEVFGPQNHGNIIGMETGVKISQIRTGDQSRRALRQENANLQNIVKKLTAAHESVQNDLKALQEKLEVDEARRIAERKVDEARREAEREADEARREAEREADHARRFADRIEMERRMEEMMLRYLGNTPTNMTPHTSVPIALEEDSTQKRHGVKDAE